MSTKSPSYAWIREQHRRTYVPATVEAPDGFKRLKSSIPLALQETPNSICGLARRVGWTHEKGANKEAIYRLKLQVHLLGVSNATIPGFFVLKDGVFVEFVPPHGSPF